MTTEYSIPESEIDDLLADFHIRRFSRVTSPRFDIRINSKHEVFVKTSIEQFRKLSSAKNIERHQRILDVGCGFGYFVTECQKRGFPAYGAEIDAEKLTLGRRIFQTSFDHSTICRLSQPQKLPFDDNEFDWATMFYVMEHVEDPPAALKEIHRVLRPEGQVNIECPNLLFPYDAHYALPLPTWLPKSFSKPLLWAAKHDSSFLQHLNFRIRPRFLERLFEHSGFSFRALGIQLWSEALHGVQQETRSKEFQLLTRFLHVTKMRNPILKLAKFGFYTPLVYLLTKNHIR